MTSGDSTCSPPEPHTSGSSRVHVAVGSSQGDRRVHLASAVRSLGAAADIQLSRGSPIYDTAPAGGVAEGRFLNAVLEVDTSLTPRALLDALQAMEAAAGRLRGRRWDDRTLDLDVVLWGERIIREPDLRVPHPALASRRFVLQPLADLVPCAIHPELGKTVSELLSELPPEADRSTCFRLPPEQWPDPWPPVPGP